MADEALRELLVLLRQQRHEALRVRHTEALESALSELARLRGEREWKPIETAPKDGTRIILAWEGKSREGYWLDNSRQTMPWQGWKLVAMDPWPQGQPAHWQPLPVPPVQSHEEKQG